MKKNFKKFLTTALASVMALGAIVGTKPLTVEAAECDAVLGFADSSWNQNWDAATTKVTGDGDYSVTLEKSKCTTGDGAAVAADAVLSGATVFVIDLKGASTELAAEGKTYEVTAVKVTADGTDIPVDVSKLSTGDLEDNGNFRIEIYNEYGATKEASPIDTAALTFSETLKVDFSIKTVDATTGGEDGGEEPTDPPAAATFDPAGKYNAYLGIQTPAWTYRDAWNSGNGIGSEVWGQHIYNNDSGATFGKVTDAAVEGNGTYKVSITDFGTVFADDFASSGQEFFNLLYISTDIPLSDDVKVTDVKLIIDGKTIKTYDEAFLDPDETAYVKILIQNIWNDLVKELPFYNAPATSLEMQFTIAGFNYDNENAKGEEPTTAAPAGTDSNTATNAATDAADDAKDEGGIDPIVIVVIVVVVVLVVVCGVVVSKKKKAN